MLPLTTRILGPCNKEAKPMGRSRGRGSIILTSTGPQMLASIAGRSCMQSLQPWRNWLNVVQRGGERPVRMAAARFLHDSRL